MWHRTWSWMAWPTSARALIKPTRGILPQRGYAKKAPPGLTLQSQKKTFPVETDPTKLATYCCGSNIRIEGEDVKLGADEDYPDWLWTIHLGKPKQIHEISPDTEEYWETLAVTALYRKNKLEANKPKEEIRINEKSKLEKLDGLLHRALAYKYYDPGTVLDTWQRDKFRKYGPYGVYRNGEKYFPDKDPSNVAQDRPLPG